MRRYLIAAAVVAIAAPAHADCEHFKWSVAKEKEWFASPSPLPASSGEANVNTGYTLVLSRGLALPVAPERAPKPNTFAAVVNVPKLDAGLYQITLSAEAWIDVAQNGALIKSSDFSGQRDCPGVRKSVRFNLASGPATVEISNADEGNLMFAIAPAK